MNCINADELLYLFEFQSLDDKKNTRESPFSQSYGEVCIAHHIQSTYRTAWSRSQSMSATLLSILVSFL